jgi:hypothetical protein
MEKHTQKMDAKIMKTNKQMSQKGMWNSSKIHPKIDAKKGCEKRGTPRKHKDFSTRPDYQNTPLFARLLRRVPQKTTSTRISHK